VSRPVAPVTRTRPRAMLQRARAAAAAHRPIVALFAVGVVLRILVMTLYSSVVLIYYGGDSTRYLRLPFTGYHSLFSDPNAPAIYPAFLDGARWIDRNIVFTIALQHLMGIGTAVLVFLTVRRIGASLWFAMAPAAVVLLSGDFLFLETTLLTETLWMLLLAAGLCAAVYARGSDHITAWLITAGALLALASLVRSLSLPLAVPVAIWAMWELGGGWVKKARLAATVLIPVAVLVGGYAFLAGQENGYSGLTEMGGFNLYARVGQFADCRRFTPPKGTAKLCESTPPSQRSGPFYYTYGANAPLYRAGFGADPKSSKTLGKFAKAAILHQPGAYLHAVGTDLLRYVAPYAVVARSDSGIDPGGMSFASAVPASQGQSPAALSDDFSTDYGGVSPRLPGQGAREILGSYQEIFRLSGLPVVFFAALAIIGLFVADGSVRRALWLFFVLAVYLYVVPVALSSYDVRYGVPASLLLSISAALGGWAIWRRRLSPATTAV
jgi:Dolichyl-phosphate-mannose-protein mannosyltransferase